MSPLVLLRVEGLAKRYGSSTALVEASFSVSSGETVAMLGQNGAGKSTIVKIVAGVVRPTAGAMWVSGREVRFGSPRDALQAGIALIPQELAYVPPLSVAENIMLGAGGRFGMVRPASVRRAAARFADELELDVDLSAPMSKLSLAQRQGVEIAKALRHQAKILLLDEPTAALSDNESERLHFVIAKLRAKGTGLVYISHRLDEVLAHTDRVITLRDGQISSERNTAGTTHAELVDDMVGRAKTLHAVDLGRREQSLKKSMIRLDAVTHGDDLHEVSFDVRAGEVVGLFGIRGSGPEHVTRLLSGRQLQASGVVYVDSAPAELRSVRHSRSVGIAYVPSDRKRQGLVMIHSVGDNLSLPQITSMTTRGIVRRGLIRKLVAKATLALEIKYRRDDQPVKELSGGNQQKVLLAGRIFTEPKVLVIDEPSRGVDVAARREIHKLLGNVARQGAAVVFASSDVEECVALSDRLLIFRKGRIVDDLRGPRKSQVEALGKAGQEVSVP